MFSFLKPNPPPPEEPPKVFPKPWRAIEWSEDKRTDMIQEVRQYAAKLNEPDLELRFLLNGPVGSGKSSFIYSINSIFQGRAAHGALAASASGRSHTLKYKGHYIRNEKGRLPFVFNDVMGLEQSEGGVQTGDIINALKGHIPNNYTFNPREALPDSKLKLNPSLSDKCHCLVSVVAADSISLMADDVINQMKLVRHAASELDMPQLVLMTMPDKACELVMEDVKAIYASKIIKQKMETCSNLLGVPMTCILPVRNYFEEVELNNDMDILLLTAMTQMVNFANDYMWNLQQEEKE